MIDTLEELSLTSHDLFKDVFVCFTKYPLIFIINNRLLVQTAFEESF